MAEKQPYETPTLVVVGAFENLTQATWQGDRYDFAWGVKSASTDLTFS